MERGEIGLISTWNHNIILGFTDTVTVKLDFDNIYYKIVKHWAERTVNWFQLEGYIILKSSKNCYHILFNRKVSWSENVRIMAWVAIESQIQKLKDYVLMQCIKMSSTLRISSKKGKPSPRIVYRFGKEDDQIHSFLSYRRKIKRIQRKIKN